TRRSSDLTFSAYYLGNGMLKSTDNGLTWDTIAATVTNSPQIREPWDIIWNVAIDITDTINDAVYAAIQGSIQRSLNGGKTFTRVLGGQSGFLAEFTDIEIGKTGVKYAALSSDGNVKGVFRSLDGETWTNITPAIFPAVYERIVIAIDPTNENRVYFLAHTPDYGKLSNPNSSTSERNSLWVYTYQSGDGSGSGGTWEERSQNI